MARPILKPAVLKTASELVFEQLAEAILDGRYPAGSALPPERVVAESCGTSRLIVRQAVHRLADFGMVRARQGGASIVLGTEQADLRLFEVLYRIGRRPGLLTKWQPHLLESELYSMIGPLRTAALRGTLKQRKQLKQMVKALGNSPSAEDLAAFQTKFWTLIVKMSGNPVFQMEQAWWLRVVDNPDEDSAAGTPQEDLAFYSALTRLVVKGKDPTAFYLQALDYILS